MMKGTGTVAIALVLTVGALPALAQSDDPQWMRGLNELLSVEVTSVAKKEQRVVDTSAGVFVLTRDDIRRSGMTTVPDLLRLVPGRHVAQVDGNKWAITARGFNSRWANKLLVMIDERSIYSPHFAGVYWDAIDVPVHAIEHIEVVRGPGASIWGANAVNGVINIITSTPTVNRETVIAGGAGALDQLGMVSHEARLGDRVGYRLFANLDHHAALENASGQSAGNEWNQRVTGGSLVATLNARDTVEASARVSQTALDDTYRFVTRLVPFTTEFRPQAIDTKNWFATTRWTRQLRERGFLQMETTFDEWWRIDGDLDHHRRTVQLNVQHRVGARGRHDLMWGADYRRTRESTFGTLGISLATPRFTHDIVSAFVQDDIALAGDRGRITVGTKVEHREFTNWNAQPTARFHWRLTDRQGVWAAVSRAFRAPDRVERGLHYVLGELPLDVPLPAILTFEGNPDIRGEWMTAYETGYRAALGRSATLDIATFVNRYSDLHAAVPMPPVIRTDTAGLSYLPVPLTYGNAMTGTAAGGEAVLVVMPTARWQLTSTYSLFAAETRFELTITNGIAIAARVPRHQAQFRSRLSLPRHIDFDAAVFAIGAVDDMDVAAYRRIDLNLGWRPHRQLELGLGALNITNNREPQFIEDSGYAYTATVNPRSLTTRVRWRC